ncbi:hypothetical protein AUP68_00101 [Ilyonectria robusta]
MPRRCLLSLDPVHDTISIPHSLFGTLRSWPDSTSRMATLKSKTNLACDTCRHRKSRCDGIRPVCSHCKTAGRECTYRPTPTSLETDVSVLSRLTGIESRLHALEGSRNGTQANGTSQGPSQGGQDLALSTIPDLHTASAQKMLHCWPRIRLNLTLPGVISTTYLSESDAADHALLETITSSHDSPQILLWQVANAIDHFYGTSLAELPLFIPELFDICALLSRDCVISRLTPEPLSPNNASPHTTTIDLERLSIAQLLVLSLAKTSMADDMVTDTPPARSISAHAFTIALQKQWVLLSRPDEERVPLVLLTAYCLVHFWARPFQALGLLQAIDPAIKGYSLKHLGDHSVHRYARLHFILERFEPSFECS